MDKIRLERQEYIENIKYNLSKITDENVILNMQNIHLNINEFNDFGYSLNMDEYNKLASRINELVGAFIIQAEKDEILYAKSVALNLKTILHRLMANYNSNVIVESDKVK